MAKKHAPNLSRLLLLVTQLEYAGAQKIALTQARYFHAQGYQVIVCFFYDKYNLMSELQQEPYRIINLEAKQPNCSPWYNLWPMVRAIWRLYLLLRREKVQIIETLTHYSNVLGIIIAWLAGVPVRVSSQRNSLPDFPTWFLKLDAWVVNSRLTSKMVAVSARTRQFCINIEKMNPDKVMVITNGIKVSNYGRSQWPAKQLLDLRHSLQIPENAPILLTVARFHTQKGYSYLIQAIRQVLKHYPQVIFLLVGDGEEKEKIQQQIQLLQLSAHVRLTGYRPDIACLLAIATIFVLPSLYEGMPNVVLEAMSAELPVIATDVDGTAELLLDNQTGILIPSADSSAIAQAIIKLLEEKQLAYQMGQQGYERVKSQFSEQVMCYKYEQLFQTLYHVAVAD